MIPEAHLFPNGNMLVFDENGEQVVDLQKLGISGLHKFVRRYPEGKVYWSIYRVIASEIDRESLPWLLRHIRRRPGPRPKVGEADE